MSYKLLFENLEIIIVILTLISLSTNSFLAYYEFKTSTQTYHTKFIYNIIAFSMIWIIECTLIVLYFLYKNTITINNIIIEITIFAGIFIINKDCMKNSMQSFNLIFYC